MSLALILEMLPTGTLTVFADSGGESAVVSPSTYNNPVLGSGLGMFKNEAKGNQSIYYGEYPQDSTNANSYQPIKWLVGGRPIHSFKRQR